MNALPTPRMPRVPLPDPYKVQLVLDSVSPKGFRLTTWALTYPRFVHAELMTHRVFSRNSASSRAIPSEKMRALVVEHPALPVYWGKNQSGMQARQQLDDKPLMHDEAEEYFLKYGREGLFRAGESIREAVKRRWLEARDEMLRASADLALLGLHKQLCNRVTEPWMPITVLVSATSFRNWWHLRDHPDAQPELQIVATEMLYQLRESTPQSLRVGEWHLPFISIEDRDDLGRLAHATTANANMHDRCAEKHVELMKAVSTGRCARVSYLTHDGRRDPAEDIALHDKLKTTTQADDPGHFSPFEHVAMALGCSDRIGNFRGFAQYRKEFANEAGPGEPSE